MTAVRALLRTRSFLDWLLLASMAALAFNTHGAAVPLVAFLALLAVGFLLPQVLRQWWLWAGIAAVQGIIQLLRWEGIDDHVIVGTYWAVTIALGLAVGQPERVLRLSGRWMVGLIFLFAAAWKWGSPDFREANLFALYLLVDPRFSLIARVMGGLEPAVASANLAAIDHLYANGGSATSVELMVPTGVRRLASVMTWWGIALETLLSVVWIAPLRRSRHYLRHGFLVLFCVTTYGLIAITGFGMILLVMGLATTEEESRWRAIYGVGVVVMALWTPLWRLMVLN